MKKTFTTLLLCGLLFSVQSQTTTYYPLLQSQHVVWGQGYKANAFTRFPATAASSVPANVWKYSQWSAGLQVRFKTNATSITVNYGLTLKYSFLEVFSDMGANGLDLYAKKPDGSWHWLHPASRTVGSVFNYTLINPNDPYYNANGYEYCLYLPPFATVNSLNIQVNSGASFSFIPVPQQIKPIVVYGTSIVHGQQSSRPGNIWTNILSRNFPDRPIVNLGFTGVAYAEPEVIQVINQIDADIFILDCLPNLWLFNSALVNPRYSEAVSVIRTSHPNAAILFVEHAGYADVEMYLDRKTLVSNANNTLKDVYQNLINQGYKNLYYLSKDELNLNPAEDMSDHVHPNDKGMYKYAAAYTHKIAEILDDLPFTGLSASSRGEIEISPNPNRGKFSVKYPGLSEIRLLEIFDMQGNNVYTRQISEAETEISLSGEPGNYVLQITGNGEKNISKFIIY